MTTTIAVDSIQIPHEFVCLARDWHDGQSSKLYAIASTANLTCGTIRPLGTHSREEWYFTLWNQLAGELAMTVRAVSAKSPDEVDLPGLERFQRFAEQTAEQLRVDYNLET